MAVKYSFFKICIIFNQYFPVSHYYVYIINEVDPIFIILFEHDEALIHFMEPCITRHVMRRLIGRTEIPDPYPPP